MHTAFCFYNEERGYSVGEVHRRENEEMKKKILFTGNGRVVIDDLMGHIPGIYQAYKCLPSELEFLHALEKYQPDVVVTALFKETATMLRMYTELKERNEYIRLPIIVIGGEDDCATFRRNVFQKNMECFVRPIDMEEFTKKLKEYSELLEEENPVTEALKEKMDGFKKAGIQLRGESEPLVKAKPEKAAPDKFSTIMHENGRKTILVVDDDVRMLNVIKVYLEDLYEVTVVPSGKLALKYLEKKHADLVLLDYMMPEMNGPDVLKSIREGERCPDIPVIFLTGVSEKEQVLRGLELRPNGYILKPAKRETIIDRVTEVLLGL